MGFSYRFNQRQSRLLLFALLSLFASIAIMIVSNSALVRIDSAITAVLQQHISSTALTIFAAITRLGDGNTRVVLALIVAFSLLLKRHYALALGWCVALAGSGIWNRFLKSLFQRERPLHTHGFIVETDFSFPSGHASGAMTAYGMLAFVLLRLTPRSWHTPIVIAAAFVIFSIGLSRVILQVHYCSDVLAGFALGAAWLIVCIALTNRFAGSAGKF